MNPGYETLAERVADLESRLACRAADEVGLEGGAAPWIASIDIVSWVARRTGLSVSVIVGPSCKRPHVHARFAVVWGLRQLTERSFPVIGRVLGRDHSTVLVAARRAEQLRETQPGFRTLTDALVAAFTSGKAS